MKKVIGFGLLKTHGYRCQQREGETANCSEWPRSHRASGGPAFPTIRKMLVTRP